MFIQIKRQYKLLIALGLVTLLTGCPSKPKPDDSIGMSGNDPIEIDLTTNPYPNDGSTGYDSPYYNPNYGMQGTKDRVIFFDYDSDRLRKESINVLKAHAQELRDNTNKKILLEGHTDERGSREYNMGLGERRAKSVKNMMIAEGVNPSQIRIMSYGEERPAVAGADERVYAQNRRVEIVY